LALTKSLKTYKDSVKNADVGLEDAKGCERVFSRTNGCARAIHCSTKFHQKQVIDMTVKQWNAKKVQNIGELFL